MISKANVKYAADLLASVGIIVACALVIWVGLSSRAANSSDASRSSTSPPVEDITAEHLAMSIADAPLLGKASAPITIVEFSDFECPFCRRYAENTFDELKKQFIDTGIVSYAHIHYPLHRIHKFAFSAAKVAECASDQGRFWDVRARLFRAAASPGLSDESIAAVVEESRLDRPRLETCLDTVADRINRDLLEAGRVGVRATPLFLLGVRSLDGTVSIRSRINGAQPIAVFASAIRALKRR